MDEIEQVINNINKYNLNDLLILIHKLLNTLNIAFDINRYLNIVNNILAIPTNENNWNIAHELFDISLLGSIMFVSKMIYFGQNGFIINYYGKIIQLH